jgi:hypothetical protein
MVLATVCCEIMTLDQNSKTDCRNVLLLQTAVTGLLQGTNYWNGLLERIAGTDCLNRLL